MQNNNHLPKVQPPRRIYQPQYPSFMDKNPLEHPDSRPYPFSQKMLKTLAAAGFVGAILVLNPGCKSNKPVAPDTELSNPFPLSAANIPFSPSSFGTGLPQRLTRDTAIAAINNAFRSEGEKVVLDTMINRNGLTVTLNAYIPKYDIGYIWMDWSNFGKGIIKKDSNFHGNPPSIANPKAYQKWLYDLSAEEYDRFMENETAYYKNFSSPQKSHIFLIEELKKGLPLISSKKARRIFFIQKWQESHALHSIEHTKEYSLAPEMLQWKLNLKNRVKNDEEYTLFLSRMDNISFYFNEKRSSIELVATLNQELKEITQTKSDWEWEKRIENLFYLLAPSVDKYALRNDPKYQNLLIKILNITPWQKRKDQRRLLTDYIENKYISLQEAQKIDKANQEGKYFIAPISVRDQRAAYNYENHADDTDEFWLEKARLSKAYDNSNDPKERAQIYEQIKALKHTKRTSNKLNKETVIKQLEADVKAYIRWAKAQQGY